MKHLFLFLLLIITAFSCNSNKNERNNTEISITSNQDNLKIAVMPTTDCLPFYYAEKTGIFKSHGLNITLETYNAQMDCDTAISRGHVDIAYSDLIRSILLQSKGTGLRVIMGTNGYHELIVSKNKRIQGIEQLKERIIAISRHSVTDFTLDTIVKRTSINADYIFHPQINDITIRYNMLMNSTIDGAILPEPYATQAKLFGHNSIYSTQNDSIYLMTFIVTEKCYNNTKKRELLNKLLIAYDEAATQINQRKDTLKIRETLLELPIQTNIVDSIKITNYATPYKLPHQKGIDIAMKFLKNRMLIKQDYTSDSLLYKF